MSKCGLNTCTQVFFFQEMKKKYFEKTGGDINRSSSFSEKQRTWNLYAVKDQCKVDQTVVMVTR